MRFTAISLSLIMLSDFLLGAALRAEPIPVRYEQGSSHGFLALKTLDGATIATGEATQVVSRGKVTSRLIFRFKDGSVDDDVTVFTQNKVFRLLTDHHIQHGPSFPKPIDFLIDMTSGDLTSKAEDGSLSKEHMDLPSDVSNGLPPNLLLNILPSTPETRVSYIAPGKKARLIHIAIRPTGTIPFRVGAFRRKATDFTLHVELGGVTGVIAPLIGKQPTDYHIWLQAPRSFARKERCTKEGRSGEWSKSARLLKTLARAKRVHYTKCQNSYANGMFHISDVHNSSPRTRARFDECLGLYSKIDCFTTSQCLLKGGSTHRQRG